MLLLMQTFITEEYYLTELNNLPFFVTGKRSESESLRESSSLSVGDISGSISPEMVNRAI